MGGIKKQNTTGFHANSAMHRGGNTANRPEQLLIKEILEYHTCASILELEKKVTYLTEYNDYRDAILDIFMELDGKKYAIRVMGPAHDKKIRMKKDEIQGDYLTGLGYTIIDIWYHSNETTFKRNRRKLNKAELIEAFNEMTVIFYDKMEELPKENWLLYSEHKKM